MLQRHPVFVDLSEHQTLAHFLFSRWLDKGEATQTPPGSCPLPGVLTSPSSEGPVFYIHIDWSGDSLPGEGMRAVHGMETPAQMRRGWRFLGPSFPRCPPPSHRLCAWEGCPLGRCPPTLPLPRPAPTRSPPPPHPRGAWPALACLGLLGTLRSPLPIPQGQPSLPRWGPPPLVSAV